MTIFFNGSEKPIKITDVLLDATEEYFAKGTIPSQTCDIHVSVNICKDSGLPASGNCPKSKIEKKVYLIRQNHNKGRTDDTPYLLPSNFANRICNKH